VRAIGQGLKVAMLQFLKGSWKYGELETARRLAPDLTIRPLGEGFVHVNPESPDPKDVQCAKRAWEVSKEALLSGDYDMVILDEVNTTISYGLLAVDEVVAALESVLSESFSTRDHQEIMVVVDHHLHAEALVFTCIINRYILDSFHSLFERSRLCPEKHCLPHATIKIAKPSESGRQVEAWRPVWWNGQE